MTANNKKRLDDLMNISDKLFNCLQDITRDEMDTLPADVDNNNVRFHQLWKVFDANLVFAEKFEDELSRYIESIKEI